jgi:integrase/recombinase XerD
VISSALEAFIEYITVTKALSPRTVEAYRSDLSAIEHAAKKDLIALDSNAVLAQLYGVENRHTLNRKLSALNAFYAFCYKSHFREDQIKLQLSKLPKTLPKFLEYATIMQGLEQIDRSNWIGLRDYAMLLFLYATGLRVSELLQIEHRDLEHNWLHVRHGKGEKERMVPIAPDALSALQAYLHALPFESEYLWLNYKGIALSRISAYKTTQKYLGVSPHVLRHSYATALILGGADLRVVQELLGHASLNTTQVYTHIQKQNLKSTIETCHPMVFEKV